MHVTFKDTKGHRVSGRVAGTGMIAEVLVVIVHAQGRGYIVNAQTKQEFVKEKGIR